MNYYETINSEIKEYFKILEPHFPHWLHEYINTREMLKQQYISMTCGTYLSSLYQFNGQYTSLNHSIGVALIIWHFTHDKKQTLAGLFHDIATPAFKHCIDFLNKDYIKQEYTENLTSKIISNSKEIMDLLDRDHIKLKDVDDYHKYSIADNDTPRLSSDRLEYTLANAWLVYKLEDLDTIKEIYNDLEICINEECSIELGFQNKKIAREFVKINGALSIEYRNDKTRFSMQFLADIVKKMSDDGLIKQADLYNLKDSDVVDLIKKSKYQEVFNKWLNAKKVKVSLEKPNNYYCVNQKVKIRYVDPLVGNQRISLICKIAKKMIDKNLNYDMNKYVYIDTITKKEMN